jgi:bifunctional DNA-binding transcriptional regulator/antitoxin component of YhaV-PrlF toxin-antitoxin module
MLASGASDDTPDKQGRITIPSHLRAYAGLDKDCVVVGAITRVEVWDAGAWADYSAEKESAFAELNEPCSSRTPMITVAREQTHGSCREASTRRSDSLTQLPRCQVALPRISG